MTGGTGDGRSLRAWIGALEAVSLMGREPALTLPVLIERLACEHGERTALIGSTEALSYRALSELAGRLARWAERGWSGRTIGLLMPNRPAMVGAWLGLSRGGCVVALLDPQRGGEMLRHSVETAGCALVVADDALLGRVPDGTRAVAWSVLVGEAATLSPVPAGEGALPRQTALLLFTSGSTGLPKAARVTHGRLLEWSLWFAGMMQVEPEDRLYDCLPLHHSTGGIVGVGAMLVRGGSVWVAPEFSASRFWDEVVEAGCTLFLYIGELCRYLAQSAPHPRERSHGLRLACGNGLHASVWERFRERFGIPRILEFYAATEGNVSLYNCEGRVGAVGRVPPFLEGRFPLALIQVDAESGAPVRTGDGRCIRSDEGEAISPLVLGSAAPARRFDGYTDADASARKVICDVFEAGDRWFRSGDLLRRDAAGFYYFVARMGETFRWKGENVSTSEVAAAVRSCPGVVDAVAYGVTVPGRDGRAGMAAIVGTFDPAELWSQLAERLPAYAQPVFVRQSERLDLTGTFKLATARLTREGYCGGADPVWFGDRRRRRYVPCDKAVLRDIEAGTLRL